ncbi:MAG: hypothetical protein E3J54_02810 [Actinobacteria bacterium]|nr:MAG: hypothetical protein E3J54_02810 [Actinomycetota bacterium]
MKKRFLILSTLIVFIVLTISSIASAVHHSTFVWVDIKPTSCPNPININKSGVIPLAILGTEDFDVNNIDLSTLKLAGVPALRTALEDVSTPRIHIFRNCCETDGADGYLDVTAKFDSQSVLNALGDNTNSDSLVLWLTGNLKDGTPFYGFDFVIFKGLKNNNSNSSKKSR